LLLQEMNETGIIMIDLTHFRTQSSLR